jgi:DNA repair protein RAD16
MEMNNVPKKMLTKNRGGARGGTLVVCPVIALSQWKSEIEKFTETDTLTVGIYHGPNRAKEMPPEMMQKYDIVLTTYQVMEQDFRKMISPNKGTFREEVCRLPFLPYSLVSFVERMLTCAATCTP